MENKYRELPYLKIELEKAYIMGLESAVVVLEKSTGLSPEGQREMDRNPRLLVFEEHSMGEGIITDKQKNRLLEGLSKEKKEKVHILLCKYL